MGGFGTLTSQLAEAVIDPTAIGNRPIGCDHRGFGGDLRAGTLHERMVTVKKERQVDRKFLRVLPRQRGRRIGVDVDDKERHMLVGIVAGNPSDLR